MTYNSRTQLYRDTSQAKILGVCSGVADYLDVKPNGVRIFSVILMLLTGVWPCVFLYFILGFVLKAKPVDLYASQEEEQFWKKTRSAPTMSAAEMRQRFRALEKKANAVEAELLSRRFNLERELNKLAVGETQK